MTTANPFNVYNPGPAFGIGSPWGWRTRNNIREKHPGQDFPALQGTAIPAAADGVVIWNKTLGGYGNCVVIKHTSLNGPVFYTLYAHLDQPPTLALGSPIKAGATVGLVGNTGQSNGFHLHFEVIPDQLNPLVKGHTTLDPLTFPQLKGSASHYFWSNHATPSAY